MPKLNDTQMVILSAAAQRDGGAVLPPPKRLKVKDGALTNVLKGLLRKGLINEQPAPPDAPAWRESGDGQRFMLTVTQAGLEAIGIEPEFEIAVSTDTPEPNPKRRRNPTSRKPGNRKKPAKPSTKRRSSKQETIIGLLQKDKGATIADLQAATGWQPHSVRAALTGLRKKGHDILREKKDGAVTGYRIAAGRKGRKQ